MLFQRSNHLYSDCIPIKDIRPNLKNINVVFIVLEVGAATVTKENRVVRTFKVGDPTACINVSVWDEPGNLLVPGDIVRLTKGYAAIWRHCLTLYSGKNGDIHKIGDFCLNFNEHLNMSEPNPSLAAPINSLNQKNQQSTANAAQQMINNGTASNNNGNSVVLVSATTVAVTTTSSSVSTTPSSTNNATSTAPIKQHDSKTTSTGSNRNIISKTTARGGRNNPNRNNIKADRR